MLSVEMITHLLFWQGKVKPMQIAMKKEKFAKFHHGVLFWTTYEMNMVYIKLLLWHTLLLCEKCPYSELFWSVLFRIRTRITPNVDTFYTMSIWEYSNRLWLETLKMLQLSKKWIGSEAIKFHQKLNRLKRSFEKIVYQQGGDIERMWWRQWRQYIWKRWK